MMIAPKPEEVVVGVFTSALNLRERALSVQDTWLGDFPSGYLIGGYHRDPELRMISLGPAVGEDYHSAHRKQFLGLLELRRRHPEAPWFFITGCDAFVFRDNLLELLGRHDPEEELLVGGHCGKVSFRGGDFVYPAGGPGFALSGVLLDRLVPNIPDFVERWESEAGELRSACDVALAWLALEARGIRVTYAEGFYYGPPYYYPGNPWHDGEGRIVDGAVCARPIAFHNLSIREMYLLRAGRALRRPGPLARLYDAAARRATRRLRTRSLVNSVSRVLFGPRSN